VSLQAQAKERTLMYSYLRDGQMVNIAFFDISPAPVCHIDDVRELPKSAINFAISKTEFDHLWSALTSDDLKPFERRPGAASSAIDTANSLVFTTAYLPDGEKKMFVVPKSNAPKSVVDLASEIRAYNRD
jgi:hypothetical protein